MEVICASTVHHFVSGSLKLRADLAMPVAMPTYHGAFLSSCFVRVYLYLYRFESEILQEDYEVAFNKPVALSPWFSG